MRLIVGQDERDAQLTDYREAGPGSAKTCVVVSEGALRLTFCPHHQASSTTVIGRHENGGAHMASAGLRPPHLPGPPLAAPVARTALGHLVRVLQYRCHPPPSPRPFFRDGSNVGMTALELSPTFLMTHLSQRPQGVSLKIFRGATRQGKVMVWEDGAARKAGDCRGAAAKEDRGPDVVVGTERHGGGGSRRRVPPRRAQV